MKKSRSKLQEKTQYPCPQDKGSLALTELWLLSRPSSVCDDRVFLDVLLERDHISNVPPG